MSSPQPTAPASVETQVPLQQDIVYFLHGLGGPVDITAFDEDGEPAQFGLVAEIDDNEVAVHVRPGQVYRLVATLSPPEDESPTQEGMHVRR